MLKKLISFVYILLCFTVYSETTANNTGISTTTSEVVTNTSPLVNTEQNFENNIENSDPLLENIELLEMQDSESNIESEKTEENETEEKNSKAELEIYELNAYEEMMAKHLYSREEAELFGKSLFSKANSSLTLPSELEVGKNYVLSSGDVLKITLFGDALPKEMQMQSYNIPLTLSGSLVIPSIGTFNIRGKTLLEAENEIAKTGRMKYRDLKIDVSLVKMRSTRVFVMGEVANPGTYTLNPLSNLINAIYLAGGMSDNSSIRNIKILRNSKTINIDLYDYLLKGNTKDNDLILSEGDTIFLPVLSKRISIKGNVKKSYAFEIKNEKTINDILIMAGGLNDVADRENIKLVRVEDDQKVRIFETDDFDFEIKNADIITIGQINDTLSNGINIVGNVVKPGVYEKQGNETLNQMIERAGGFLPDTYFERVDVLRLESDTRYAKYSYSLESENPEIFSGDTVFVYSTKDVGAVDYVRVQGAVRQPGVYRIYKNSKVIDAIFMAEGLTDEDVYMQRADVYRLEEDGTTTVIKINLRKAIAGDETENVELKKFDIIKIYENTDIDTRDYVQVLGAVRQSGTYVLNNENNRLSDIIFEARGLQEKDVYMERATVFRLDKLGNVQMINVNLQTALNDDSLESEEENIELFPYDVVKIYTYDEVKEIGNVYVYGEVRSPGEYEYYENMSIEDLMFISKQPTMFADLEAIEIIRLDQETKLREQFYLDYTKIKDFTLREEDRVFIRKNKNFETVKVVKVTGEINYPGEYILEKDENINTILERAGGLKNKAFPQGAKIIRDENLDQNLERLNKRVVSELNNIPVSSSATTVSTITNEDTEITNLGYDSKSGEFRNNLLLQDGDEIIIPSIPSTVKIIGEVYFPREIGYENENSNFDYYLQAAGGITEKAYAKKIFIIKADGKVEKNKNMKIEPGDTIVVPHDPREKERFDFFKDSLEFFQWLVTVLTAYTLITQ